MSSWARIASSSTVAPQKALATTRSSTTSASTPTAAAAIKPTKAPQRKEPITVPASTDNCEPSSAVPIGTVRPRGLRNQTNVCFANAVLQCMLACDKFRDAMSLIQQSNSATAPTTRQMLQFLCRFKEATSGVENVGTAQQATVASVPSVSSGNNEWVTVSHAAKPAPAFNHAWFDDSLSVEEMFGATLDRFASTSADSVASTSKPTSSKLREKTLRRQQDAHEFFAFLLDSLNVESTGAIAVSPAASSHQHLQNANADDEWHEVDKRNKHRVIASDIRDTVTPIERVFGGRFRSVLRKQGIPDSVSYQPFVALPLDITEDTRSVEQAIASFMREEPVFGFLKPGTQQEIRASRFMSLERLPAVLVLHLKRFWFDDEGPVKLQNDIAYPLELRLSSSHLFGDASQQPSRYRLRGLVTHVGSRVGDGHYKALCRYNTSAATQCFSPHDVWFEFDDEHIDVITDEASILSRTSGVYLLFYEAIP